MGRNWPDYIKEAKRCLATNGYLLIAETTKSQKGRLSELKEVMDLIFIMRRRRGTLLL
jgi:cyclopropane fatty-acyl-phospholipid synthase-like methyltransferase